MTKQIKFMQDEHSCPTCDLVIEHIEGISESNSPEELFDRLLELVHEAQHQAVVDFLGNEIESKIGLFKALTGQDTCECDQCCEECCDGGDCKI